MISTWSFPLFTSYIDSAALRQQVEALKGKLQRLEVAFSHYQKGEFLDTNKIELGLLIWLSFALGLG